MLGDDEGEEGFADGVGFELEGAEAIFEDVEVLGGEGDEAALGEGGGEGLVVVVAGLADGVLGAALEAVLADDYGTASARGDVIRDEQEAVGEQAGEDVEDDLVGGDAVGIGDGAGCVGWVRGVGDRMCRWFFRRSGCGRVRWSGHIFRGTKCRGF